MSHTVTITTERTLPVLQLRRPEPLDVLIRELQRFSLWSPEERGALASSASHLEESPVESLTYLLLYAVQPMLCRYEGKDPAIEADLLRWEKELLEHLQKHLPVGVSAEAFVAEHSRFCELETHYAEMHAPFEATAQRTQAHADALLASLIEELDATQRSLVGRVQQQLSLGRRVEGVLQIAREALSAQEELLARAGETAEALAQQEKELQETLATLERTLHGGRV